MCVRAAELVARGSPALDVDEALWLASERAVEVAGEAAGQPSDETTTAYPTVPWRELRGTRVVLAHSYHRVDRDLLWDILRDEMPAVAEALGPLARLGDRRWRSEAPLGYTCRHTASPTPQPTCHPTVRQSLDPATAARLKREAARLSGRGGEALRPAQREK